MTNEEFVCLICKTDVVAAALKNSEVGMSVEAETDATTSVMTDLVQSGAETTEAKDSEKSGVAKLPGDIREAAAPTKAGPGR